MEGVDEVFAKYPDIKVFGQGHRQMGRSHRPAGYVQLPVRLPEPDRLLDAGWHGIGALQAVMAANPAVWPQGVGEGRLPVSEALGRSPDHEPGLR